MAIKSITQSAKDKPCIKCGKTGETRAAHYNGPRQHSYGKGRGRKCHDLVTAELCHSCDQEFTEGSTSDSWASKWERSEDFLHYVTLTNIRRYDDGELKNEKSRSK